MNIQIINPLADKRWDALVARHPRASAFHSRGWLEALSRTYGYEPLALTSAAPGESLNDGMLLCRISSWITGTRLVSLPFADHCDPLVDGTGGYREFIDRLREECDRNKYKYLEIRPLCDEQARGCGLQPGASYCFHELSITPSLEQLFKGLHKDSIQRKIRRAEKEQLTYEAGRTKQLAAEFYHLLLITRRRHQLPPQPRSWFKNLVECMGDALQIRVARKNGTAIATMLTLRHGSSVIYKYGCSDAQFHQAGGMPFLFWKLIEESKASGVASIDFGRSDLDNEGLITFKDRFGATKKLLTYYRYPKVEMAEKSPGWNSRAIRQVFSILPDAVLSTAGKILYKHIG